VSITKTFNPRRRAAAFSRAATALQPGPIDLQEQSERIKNLEADTALKLQSLRHANIQLAVSVVAVLGTLVGVVVGAVTVYLDHHDAPKPAPTFIFLSPSKNTVL
jgi:hypothetical protein